MLTIAGGILLAIAACVAFVMVVVLVLALVAASNRKGEPWYTVPLGLVCLAAAVWFAGPAVLTVWWAP